MEHLIIGLIVGIVMGLTGAGGALISIPLFLYLLNTTVKEATVLSLIAVMLGTLVNLFGQSFKPNLKIVLPIVIFGALANFATLPLKEMMADMWIAGILVTIGAYSLWSIWNPGIKKVSRWGQSFLKTSLIGLGLGVITTLTGLGGGVLLIPILINFFGKSYEEALPTSLLTILMISAISFLAQINVGMKLINLPELGLIAVGAVSSFFLLKQFLKMISKDKIEITRKMLFTIVTIYSVSSVVIKSL
jgi:uncharacterized membrane protein YfcA